MFADARLLENEDFLLAVGLLLGALLLAGLALLWLDRWRKRQAAAEHTRTADALSSYRTLYDRGELSKEEYDVIRHRLALQIREEVGMPPPGSVKKHPERKKKGDE